jgi:hypothetical protein
MQAGMATGQRWSEPRVRGVGKAVWVVVGQILKLPPLGPIPQQITTYYYSRQYLRFSRPRSALISPPRLASPPFLGLCVPFPPITSSLAPVVSGVAGVPYPAFPPPPGARFLCHTKKAQREDVGSSSFPCLLLKPRCFEPRIFIA